MSLAKEKKSPGQHEEIYPNSEEIISFSRNKLNKTNTRISMKRLKRFAKQRLPKNSSLRSVIDAEKDSLTPEEFLAKAFIWLRLVRGET